MAEKLIRYTEIKKEPQICQRDQFSENSNPQSHTVIAMNYS